MTYCRIDNVIAILYYTNNTKCYSDNVLHLIIILLRVSYIVLAIITDLICPAQSDVIMIEVNAILFSFLISYQIY